MTDVKEVPIEDQVKVPIYDDDEEKVPNDAENPIEDEIVVHADNDEIKDRSNDDEVKGPKDDDEDIEAPLEDQVQAPTQSIEINAPLQDVEINVPIQNDQVSVPTNNDQVNVPPQNQLKVPTYNKVIKPRPSSSSNSLKSSKNLFLNTLNVLGYILNLSTSYLGGVAGWFGGKPNAELSAQYQTLITPIAPLFGYIWGLIFLSQGLFVAAQILPRYKDRALVQRGVNVWYFGVCLAQSAWTVAFGFEFMVTAFVFMVAILICLGRIVFMQWTVIAEEERNKESDPWLLENDAINMLDDDRVENTAPPPTLAYWLLRFPFAVHAGWIAPATPLMLSVALLSYKAGTQAELWTAMLGVAVLFGMSMGLILRQDKGAPSYVIPGVVAYACAGIMLELDAPSDSILGRFQEEEISLMKNVAGFCGAMLLVTIVSRFFAILIRDYCCIRKYDDEEDDNVIYVEVDDL